MPAMTLHQLKRAVETGNDIESAAREVLRYGQITRDREWSNDEKESRYYGEHRVRTLAYLGYEWRHVMHNGELVSLGYKKV